MDVDATREAHLVPALLLEVDVVDVELAEDLALTRAVLDPGGVAADLVEALANRLVVAVRVLVVIVVVVIMRVSRVGSRGEQVFEQAVFDGELGDERLRQLEGDRRSKRPR